MASRIIGLKIFCVKFLESTLKTYIQKFGLDQRKNKAVTNEKRQVQLGCVCAKSKTNRV